MIKKIVKRMFSPFWLGLVVAVIIFNYAACTKAIAWQVGAPITTYYSGPGYMEDPDLTDARAQLVADGFFNLVWSPEDRLDIAYSHGLRALLQAPELQPWTNIIYNPTRLAALDALINRVKNHPALYAYFVVDEPGDMLSDAAFPELGALVAHIRAQDPAHPCFINLYGVNTGGTDLTTLRNENQTYLNQFISQVDPDILSNDFYPFFLDAYNQPYTNQWYFLNLSLLREAALAARGGVGIPFMAITQACTWDAEHRAPNTDELRWENSTTLAYGAQAISYFVYSYSPFYHDAVDRGVDPGQMVLPDEVTTTALYTQAQYSNIQFHEVATQLQPLRSLGAYHVGTVPLGAAALPDTGVFHLDFTPEGMSQMPAEGMLLGYFGDASEPDNATHVLVVNMNRDPYTSVTTTVVGPGSLSTFDDWNNTWTACTPAGGYTAVISLPPGGAQLLRVNLVAKVTSPANGSVIIGDSVPITATASSLHGVDISAMSFFESSPTWAYLGYPTDGSFNWTNVPGGTYQVLAAAYDTNNDYTVSLPISITFWNTADINASGGSASYSNGTFTVAGKGAGITSTADGFRFVYQQISGDCTITAKITGLSGTTYTNGRTGVMMRQDTASGAIEASSLYKPLATKQYAFHRRTAAGGTTSTTVVTANTSAPWWVRVTRVGNTLKAYKSTNGTSWTQVGSNTTVTMSDPVQVGLVVTSGNTSNANTATFSNVTITQP